MNNKESINLTRPSYIVLGFLAYLNLCYVQMQRLANFVVSINDKLFLLVFFFVLPSNSWAGWEEQTHLVSKEGDECLVRGFKNEDILFRNKDPQQCVEWSLSNGLNTVVLAGEYIFDDRIDVPRPGITLIVDEGAVFKLNPDTKHSTISFKARNPDYWGMIPLIYNKGHSDVKVLMFGELVKYRWETKERGRQTMPIIFDGRNVNGDCGLSGGMMLVLSLIHI